MKYLVISLVLIGFIGTAYAESQAMLTPFDVYFSPDDFTAQGPNHNILALDRGDSAALTVYVKNNDDKPHQITLKDPRGPNLGLFETFSFEPEQITVMPHQTNSTKLYLTISKDTHTHSSLVTFIGQSATFGMKGLGFYVVVDREIDDYVDKSLRSGLPGGAFPRLNTGISETDAERLIGSGFGTPKYLPLGYEFRGMDGSEDQQRFVYSPAILDTESTTFSEFWNDGGLLIFYSVDGPNVNNTKSLPIRVAQDEGQQIMVNGMMGDATEKQTRTVAESNITYDVPASVTIFDDAKKKSAHLRANIQLDELLRIASSIPVFDEPDFTAVENMSNQSHSIILPFDAKEKTSDEFMEWCKLHYEEKKCKELYPKNSIADLSSPLKQTQSGISFQKIQCSKNLVLIQKYDGAPACVKPETSAKLVERGWTKHETKSSYDLSLSEGFEDLPEVVAFYETYDVVQVSERGDHISYSSGSDDGYFVRMNLFFDETHDMTDVDFHCYFQRVHQYELPPEHIEQKIVKYDCKEHGKTVESKSIAETTKDSQAINDLINLENISTLKPNSMEWFYYPEYPIHEKSNKPIPKNTDTYGLFMLIRLPEWMGGDANDASAYRAYSAKSLDDACIIKYWPDEGRQRIENPCQGGMYRIVDGAMTTGLIYRSTLMTALPYLDLSVDDNGLLYVEPPRWTKTDNGVIGYGREISFDDFRNGSEFLADSFAKSYPDYPPIPLQFAGYDLSEIAPEQYGTNVSYLDFPDNSGKILMVIGKQSVGTGHTYWPKSQTELFQLGDTTITVNKYVFQREDDSDDERLMTYEVRFKDDGFYYAINGKNVEFIKMEIVRNFFPEHGYDDMLLISKDSD